MTYATEMKAFVRKLLRTRGAIVKAGISKTMNVAEFDSNKKFLNDHMTIKHNDLQAAKFFKRHSDRIGSLIPGTRSSSHIKFWQEFFDLQYQANTIINPNTYANETVECNHA